MRIITVAIIDPLGKHGGLHYYTDGMASGLTRAGCKVLVYVSVFTGVTGNELYETLPAFGQLYGTDSVLLRGWRFVRGMVFSTVSAKWKGAKTVILHTFHYGAREFISVWLARVLGMKVVLTLHDVESFGRPGPQLLRFLVLEGATGFILHNSFSLSVFDLSAKVKNKPRIVVPHGNYIDQLSPVPRSKARAELGLPNDSMIFLFFGNSRPEKGLDLLLEACSEMKDQTGWVLVIAGKMNPKQLKQCLNTVKLHGLDYFVRVDAKHISDDEVVKYYGAADLVVVPYKKVYESGVTIMSMSLGRATLVSNLEPLVESVARGEAGLVFEACNQKSLLASLRQATEHRISLDVIGARAHKHVTTARDWTLIGEKIRLFMEEVCAE